MASARYGLGWLGTYIVIIEQNRTDNRTEVLDKPSFWWTAIWATVVWTTDHVWPDLAETLKLTTVLFRSVFRRFFLKAQNGQDHSLEAGDVFKALLHTPRSSCQLL